MQKLSVAYPALAAEWHPTKNGDLTPDKVNTGSKKIAWWVGAICGHEWDMGVVKRTNRGDGCPICSGHRLLSGFNDLETLHPLVAQEFHSTRNGTFTAKDIHGYSQNKYWWQCKLGHEWEATVNNRTKKTRPTFCPVCAGKKIIGTVNSLAILNPVLAAEWHPTKNDFLLPSQVSAGSAKSAWWLGKCGHEWVANISKRAVKDQGCPYCSGNKILLGFNDLATTHPILSAQIHPTKNAVTANELSAGSDKKVFWVCPSSHEWEAYVYSRTGSTARGCPKCRSYVSKAEQEISDYLIGLGLTVEQSNRSILDGKEIDIYIPEKKLAIEFNGVYWHSEAHKDRIYHYDKWLSAKKSGIQLIQVWEDDWNRDKNVILNGLKHKLGLNNQEKIFARKTKVIELNTREAQIFLNSNHIQGFASGSYYLGLKDKTGGKTKAVLVLKKEAGTEGKTLNIIRYATSTNVVGGFTKLLAYATKTYSPENYVTFSDHCISDGGLYKNNGFVTDKEIAPDYMYVVKGERKHKFGYRLKRFKNDPDLIWEEGLTERELAQLNGLYRIWDAGKTRWVFKV